MSKLTFTDQSQNMLEEGRQKHSQMTADFVLMDSHRLNFENDTFDTVVDTFGLCSFEHPEEVLQEMQRVSNFLNITEFLRFVKKEEQFCYLSTEGVGITIGYHPTSTEKRICITQTGDVGGTEI